MSSLTEYLRETRGEMKHVVWPTRSQTIAFTVLVLIIAVATSLLLGFFDFLFSKGLSFIIR